MKNTKLNLRSTTFGCYAIFLSLLLGYLSDLIFLFSVEIWIVWFITHLSFTAIVTLLGEKGILYMEDGDRVVYIILSFLTVLWYLNRLELSRTPDVYGFVENCNKDLLLITSITSAFVSMFVVVTSFLSLFFF